MSELKSAIKDIMKSENVSEVKAITALQSAAAQLGNESVLEELIKIKRRAIDKLGIL